MSKITKVTAVSTILASSVLLSGCGLFGGGEQNKIDPPKEVSYDHDGSAMEDSKTSKQEETSKDTEQQKVKTELYLIDKNGFVVPQTIELPNSEGVAKQALEHLVDNGPVSNILPNGFRAVLPADTEVNVNIAKGVATADFSSEFESYKKEDELKILQAITWTLTQFDSVKTVKLQINGHELKEMPVNGTPIEQGMSRAQGINLDTSGVADITNTKPLTVYYVGGEPGSYYYVPVTKRVSETKEDNIAAVVEELIEGPSYTYNLVSGFVPDVKLLDAPKLADGKVTLNFNKSLLGSFKEKKVSKSTLDALVLSLTEQKGIESVELQVNGSAKLLNDEGKPLSEPVMRPEKVNTGSF
ncbi:sporulation protein [Peribacillus cavernae]|uniref:Sporulation protein n=1 Tax=Peribacillus cavernae TaxID=1674310 RepID=A0A3S0W247_9BACI|nr:GerMN domain-containing protein [Peribacillus cavernae]MDQ0220140.1 germination protein M [Peribacillus cavernae]RUQ24200.1 sporulation protein [Peribacillus cavernae]